MSGPTPPSPRREALAGFLGRARSELLWVLAALGPLPSVEVWKLAAGPAQARAASRIGPGDLVLALLAGTIAMELALRPREWRRLLPPVASLAVVAAAAASAVFAGEERSWASALRELVQLVEILVVCYGASFYAASGGPASRRRALLALASAAGVHVAFAAAQLASGADPFHVRGLFHHRNALGCFLAVATPPLVAVGVSPGRSRALRAWALAVAAGGMLVTTSGWLLAAQAAGAILAASVLGARRGAAVAACAAVIAFAVQPLALPAVSRAQARSVSFHLADEAGRVGPSMRLRRWVAVGCCFLDNPIFGIGPGQFQARIGEYYRPPYDKPIGSREDVSGYDVRFDEPGSQGLFEVALCETGAAGLAALLWFLVSAAARAAKARRNEAAAGSLGSAGAVLLGGAFAGFLVRGVGLPLAMVLALGDAAAVSARERPLEVNAGGAR